MSGWGLECSKNVGIRENDSRLGSKETNEVKSSMKIFMYEMRCKMKGFQSIRTMKEILQAEWLTVVNVPYDVVHRKMDKESISSHSENFQESHQTYASHSSCVAHQSSYFGIECLLR